MNAPRLRRLALVAAVGLVAAVALVVAAKAAARLHHDDALWALAGWTGPFDLKVFLEAGDAVLAGRSPYPDPGTLVPPSSYYVYPPLLALLIAPLSVLSGSAAASIFTVLGIFAVAGALYALDVRDWRCYLLALLYPYTREALGYGAIGTFLTLFVALGWRYRDDARATGVAAGIAIALKLFLAPLLLWLAFTRRFRAAVLGGAVAIVLALLTWAMIGFDGLADYPRLLRELSDLEAEQSYSAVAVLASLGLPSAAATAGAIAAGVGLLALGWRQARVPSLEGDRRALTLVIGASLVLTPILWLHYLVVLIVPIALARPRLSALWLVPLAALVPSWLDWYGGWANGDLPALLSTAAIVAAALAGSLVADRTAGARRDAAVALADAMSG